MKKKMPDQTKMVLFYLLAIAVFAGVYCLVFTKMNEKRVDLEGQNEALQQEVTNLQNMEASKDTVLDETAQLQSNIGDILREFPSEVRIQNAIFDLNQMYESIQHVKIESESYTMNQLFYQPESATTDENGNIVTAGSASPTAVTADTPVNEVVSAAANYLGYRSDISVVFTATYGALKEVVNFINESKERMTITDISVTRLENTEDLSCNMTVSMYAITGTGEEYRQPDVKDSKDGVRDIFRNNPQN